MAKGIYYVELIANNLVSELTVIQQVYVQEHVEGLYMSPIYPIEPGQPTVVTWQIAHGTDVEYQVDMGDGTTPLLLLQSEVGNVWTLEYVYESPGSYQLSLTASNRLNSLEESAVVHVEYPIQGLRAFIHGNSTVHTDKSAYIFIEVDQGTNVAYTCDYNDGSAPIVTTGTVCRHMFIDLGYHLVSVFAENHLSQEFTFANESYEVILPPIPQRIENLEIVAEESTILGRVTYFQMSRTRGNRYNCTWAYGDGHYDLMDQSMVYDLFTHTYERAGRYEVMINCSNFFSRPVQAYHNMTIQEPVRGLNFSSLLTGQYGTNLTLTIALEGGTDPRADVYFNRGVFPVTMTGLAGGVTIPPAAVNVTGWQDISVTARNMVPPELTVTSRIYLEAQITNLVMWADNPYVTIGSIVTFHISFDLGTDIHLEWYFGDNVVLETFVGESRGDVFTMKHLYTEEGLYAAMVIASNGINMAFNTPLLIAVEEPVQGFHVEADERVRYPDGVIKFTITWNLNTRDLPDNTTIVIDLGNGEQPTEIPLDSIPAIQYYKMNNVCMEYAVGIEANPDDSVESALAVSCDPILDNLTDYLDGHSLLMMEISHQFQPGVYDAVITIGNMASRQEFKFTVQTQVPVKGCVAEACYMKDSDCVPGGGPDESFFPLETPVIFKVTCANGTGMIHIWVFGDGHTLAGPKQVAHHYELPGEYAEFSVIAGNIFGWEKKWVPINIQESVVGLYISQGPITSQEISVIVFALQPGSASTFSLTIPAIGYQETINVPSFNVTLKSGALSRWNEDAHIPFNVSTAAVSYHDVLFPSAGHWEVIVTGVNYASEATVHGFVSVSDEGCELPSINILGISDNLREPTTFRGNQQVLVMAEVRVSCPLTEQVGLAWKIYPLLTFGGALLPPANSSALDLPSSILTSAMTLNLDPGTLHYGRYTVELLATLNNIGEVNNRRLAFLEVVPSELVATISGGVEETVEEGGHFTIDGSGSGDPDEGFFNTGDAEDTVWFCRLGNETINLETGAINGKGCFGYGVGRITNGTVTLSYWTHNLTRHDKFVFMLLVKQEGRDTAMASKTIRVKLGVSYPIAVRCMKNCGGQLNPSMELVLAADCDCEANETDVSYNWEIAGLERDDLLFYSATSFQSSYLQLSSSLFANSTVRSFDISLTANIGRMQVGYVKYTYQIADELVRGTCAIIPSTGVALFTEFDVSCQGFASSHPPLLYRFLVSRDEPVGGSMALFSLLGMSPGQRASGLVLPAGFERHDHRVHLRVEVKDVIGVTATVDLSVEVLPAEGADVVDQLLYIQSGNPSLLDLAEGKGDQQRVTSLVAGLSEAMNEDRALTEGRNLTKEAKEEVRQRMVSTLEEVEILTLDFGRQTTSALSAVIAQPDEINIETQSKAVEIYSDILEMARQGSGSNPEAASEIYHNFMTGAPSLLQAAAIHTLAAMELIEPEPTLPPEETSVSSSVELYPRVFGVSRGENDTSLERAMYLEQMREIRDLTEQVLEMLEMVGTLIIQSEVPSESPVMIHQSEMLVMTVLKVTTLQAENRLYTMPDGSWLRLPAEVIERVKDQAVDNEIITQMYSFPSNPFTWHDTDINILTSVIGFTLKNTRGEELHVSDLNEEVEVLLPRGGQSALSFDTMTAYTHELITVSFNVTEPSSSIHIDIHPSDLEQGGTLEAYLRFGFLPSMNTYDLKTTLPSEVTVMSFNQSANFTTNPYTWFIPEDNLYATGSYYLAIRVVTDVSQRGNETLVSEVDVDVKIYTARCLFWSPGHQLWLPDGCQVGSMTTSSFTHCLCDHLTFIGGTFSVPPAQQIVFEEEAEVVLVPIMSDLVTYIAVLLALIAVISFIGSSVTDFMSRKKIFRDLDMLGDLYIVEVFTGLSCNATTTAQVFIVLHGEHHHSNPVLLTNDDMCAFRKGSVDTFLVPTPEDLGDIISITMWQDGHGYSPSWYLSRATLEHYQSGRQWTFLCNSKMVKPNRGRTFTAASMYQTAKHRHLLHIDSLMETMSTKIPLLSCFTRPCLETSSFKERVCAFFTSLSIAALLTTILKALMANPGVVTNALSIDMDSVVDGGIVGGAVLLLYYLMEFTYRSLQPRLPGAPRSAEYRETANNEDTDVRLKEVKKVTSLGDVTVQPQDESPAFLTRSKLGMSDEWDANSQSNLNNSASGLIRSSPDARKQSDWLKKPTQKMRGYVTSLHPDRSGKFNLNESPKRKSGVSCFGLLKRSTRVEKVSDWNIPLCSLEVSSPNVNESMNIQNPGFIDSTPVRKMCASDSQESGDARLNIHQMRRSLESHWPVPSSSGNDHIQGGVHKNIHSPGLMRSRSASNWPITARRQADRDVPVNMDMDMHESMGKVQHDRARSPGSPATGRDGTLNIHSPGDIEIYDWTTSSGCATARPTVPVEDIIVDVHDSDGEFTQGSESELPECDRERDWSSPPGLPGAILLGEDREQKTCLGYHHRARNIAMEDHDQSEKNRGTGRLIREMQTLSQPEDDREEKTCFGYHHRARNIVTKESSQARGNSGTGRHVRESQTALQPGEDCVEAARLRYNHRARNISMNEHGHARNNAGTGRHVRGRWTISMNEHDHARNNAGTGRHVRGRWTISEPDAERTTGSTAPNVSSNNANAAAEVPRRHQGPSLNISASNSNTAKAVRFQDAATSAEPSLSLLGRLREFCLRVSHRRRIPWWFCLLFLPITFAVIPVSAFGTFSFTFGKYTLDMTYRWITTFGTASIVFLFAPVLVACVSLFVVSPLRRPRSVLIGSQGFEERFRSSPARRKAPETKSFDKAKLFSCHNIASTERGTPWRIMVHVLWFFFLVMLGYTVLQQRSASDYYAVENIKEVFTGGNSPDRVNFYQVTNFESFWSWSEVTLIPSILATGHESVDFPFLVLSTPRIRQFRVDPSIADVCRKLLPMDPQISNCSSIQTQDRGQYVNSWSSPIMSETLPRQDQGYHYYTSEEMPGTTAWGSIGLYPSGGFVVEIPAEPGTADYILQRLKQRRWLDEDTLAVLIELSVYNIDTDLTGAIRLLLESAPTGYLIPSVDIRCIHVERGNDFWALLNQCLEIILPIVAVGLLIKELASVHAEGGRYYRDLSCLVNLLTMIAALAVAASGILRRLAVSGAMFTAPDFGAISKLSYLNDWYTATLSVTIFMVMVRQITVLSLTDYFMHLGSVLKNTSMALVAALPFFLLFMFGLTWTGWVLFSGLLVDFHTHLSSFLALISARLGSLRSSEGIREFSFPMFVMLYTSLCAVWGLIAFSAVAMQSYSAFRVGHAFDYFIEHGKLTGILQRMKSKIMVRETLKKVRKRKRVIAREYRWWRNQQPIDRRYLKRIVRSDMRAGRLLGSYREENQFMVENPDLLVDVMLENYKECRM